VSTKKGRGSRRVSAERAEELRAARRRALGAKTGLATIGVLAFGAAAVFAQRSYAGHSKQPTTALEAPPRFVRIVKQDLLQAGVVGPAQAPPGAATAPS